MPQTRQLCRNYITWLGLWNKNKNEEKIKNQFFAHFDFGEQGFRRAFYKSWLMLLI